MYDKMISNASAYMVHESDLYKFQFVEAFDVIIIVYMTEYPFDLQFRDIMIMMI